MPSPFDRVAHDVGVKPVAPLDVDDPRVPTAEETSLQAEISFSLFKHIQGGMEGWVDRPSYDITPPRTLTLNNSKAHLSSYPGILEVPSVHINLPLIGTSSTAIVKEKHYLYLMSFVAETGAEHDPMLGQVSFQYRSLDDDSLQTITKENALRYRVFWAFILAKNELSVDALYNTIPLDATTNKRRLTIANTTSDGFALSTLTLFALDPNLSNGKTYEVLPESLSLLPALTIRRYQNYQERGYTWGYNGEAPLEKKYNLASIGRKLVENAGIKVDIWRRLNQEIFAGKPGVDSTYARSVQNLTSGPVGGNPGHAGEAASSPNGSVALANDQRISFTNQAYRSRYVARSIQASNDGNGNAFVIFTLASPPSGTRFSEKAIDHKVYASNGDEISSLGKFQNLGGTGALTWTAGPNAASYLLPGQRCIFSPGILYPAGSGFNIPFSGVEKVFVNGTVLSDENVRMAHNDIAAYEPPANSENFIVVVGRERAALHYIYRKVSVTTDTNGVLKISDTATGMFAFIAGITGRIDSPVYKGLPPNTVYDALIYYAPKGSEYWQFLFQYPYYEGSSNEDALWLNGAEIISPPLMWVHTQGGGNVVFQGSSHLQYVPIAMHLPASTDSIRAYELNTPIQFMGESYLGPITLREITTLTGSGATIPIPGQVISATLANNLQARSLRVQLSVDGSPIGFRSPLLSDRAAFQSILAFAVRKGQDIRICLLTKNGRGGETIYANSDLGTGIDTFKL